MGSSELGWGSMSRSRWAMVVGSARELVGGVIGEMPNRQVTMSRFVVRYAELRMAVVVERALVWALRSGR